ncbi:hypothetical protein MHTCC0001_19060 [Flavobacteriaceae bacterium MHTCC 0001]
MAYSESEYIDICKKQLEAKFSFGNGHGYTQKDLELLSNYIEEATGVYISLSTLKRLWKNNFKKGPQLATLNALVGVLGYNNWQHFKLQHTKQKNVQKEGDAQKIVKRSPYKIVGFITVFIGFFGLCIFYIVPKTGDKKLEAKVKIDMPVVFSADKTLGKGTPNTVVFNYDVTGVKADSFFIQQSWNDSRRQKIDPKQNVFSDIYYEAGYHRAKLYANDSIIATLPIHILSNGWEPHAYYDISDKTFIHFKGASFIKDGQFHVSKPIMEKMNIDFSKRIYTRVSHSYPYNISSDNFKFSTRVKLDKDINEGQMCPRLKVFIVTEVHIFYVGLVSKGCEFYGQYKLGELYKGGKDNDLSLLG